MSMAHRPHKQKTLGKADIRNLQHNVAVLVMERQQTNERLIDLETQLLQLTEEFLDMRKGQAEGAKAKATTSVAPLT